MADGKRGIQGETGKTGKTGDRGAPASGDLRRDIWLFIISMVVAFALILQLRQQKDVSDLTSANEDRITEITHVLSVVQSQRRSNYKGLCERSNTLNAALVSFVETVAEQQDTPSNLAALAQKAFSQQDCEAITNARIGPATP